MAYCIFDLSFNQKVENQTFDIVDWGILNLLPEKVRTTCNQAICPIKKSASTNKIENFFIASPTSSPPIQNICGKLAKYKKGESTFCERHAKTSSYKKLSVSPSKLNKKSIEELQLLYDGFQAPPSNSTIRPTKKNLIEKIQKYIENQVLEPIKEVKSATSNTIDLISIGHSLNRLLTEVLEKADFYKNITHVIIENQISPIANRMKTIQGMLAQYFIMKYGTSCHIEFVSSVNKLKFAGKATIQREELLSNVPIGQSENTGSQINPEYKKHKKDGIFYCRGILESNEWLNSHIELFNTKKKDDLADCFLQGIWYIKNRL
jgi:hypothetical protein